MWILTEDAFEPERLHHKETIFTIGNGYLSTRGAFEEGYPNDRRATFVHGVFDDAPVVFTELANAPDWLPLTAILDGERFSLDSGKVEHYERKLDLHTGLLTREVQWVSPSGKTAHLTFERFANLANPHLLWVRCQIIPDFDGWIELRAGLHGWSDNEGLAHWQWVKQGQNCTTGEQLVYLVNRTRRTQIEFASVMRFVPVLGKAERYFWDAENSPTIALKFQAVKGKAICAEKLVAVANTRDSNEPLEMAFEHIRQAPGWVESFQANQDAWEREWERTDVVIEGDEEAQIAVRFNLFQLLIAAPRTDEHVNIGAKTLSGFGYRGHCFWDTEIFMLPLFIYTAPHIARNLLSYRWHNLPGARAKAKKNGFEGAQFPWESAGEGVEVTPNFVPHFSDPRILVRIWTGDIEIHISADIAYAAYQYWRVTGDQEWFIERGAELVLDIAKFWGSRAEWNDRRDCFEYKDVIGPDEYHEHVDNNAYTNALARWNLETALEVLDWLKSTAPQKAKQLSQALDLSNERLAHWREVIDKIYFPMRPDGVIEQFEGYFQLKYVDLEKLEPRDRSAQAIFGIQGCNETQILKQPDVLMLQYLLPDQFDPEIVLANYDFYSPRTDHTYGSSLGPSIQAVMACRMGRVEEAYEHFIRAAHADLRDVRGNARDGIHAASAGGSWQAVVFGFANLRLGPNDWSIDPSLPVHWRSLRFKFFYRGQQHTILIENHENGSKAAISHQDFWKRL